LLDNPAMSEDEIAPTSSGISIIIPVYQSPRLIDVLSALENQSASSEITEIIIVGKYDFSQLPKNMLLRTISVEENPTSAHNRNIGAKVARSKWLFFLDSDCLPRDHWLETILTNLNDDKGAITGSVTLPAGYGYWNWCDHLTGFSNQVSGISKEKHIPYATMTNFVIGKEVFIKVGQFDESLHPTGEDREFCWRLLNDGYQIYFVPKACVEHLQPVMNLCDAWDHLYRYGQGTANFRLRHINQSNIIWHAGNFVSKIPLIGELIGFIFVCLKLLSLVVRKPGYLHYLKYLPGVFVLNLAHTFGMIHTLRNHVT
jgi:GT2 family glycosyltransferase